jgi:hypothetical protein
MKVGSGAHLTYCSNIHAGERWQDVEAAVTHALPELRSHLDYTGPLAIGLRLSAEAARALEEPDALGVFRQFLQDGRFYVPTINGFPYGAFHGTRVKERVYLPDWRDPARLEYSNRLARLLATLASDGGLTHASVSTVPGAFQHHVQGPADVAAIADGILAHAAYLDRLRQDTGVTIVLGLEPEPCCHLETAEDARAFFLEYLFNADRVAAAARRTGSALSVEVVAQHVGVCLDACHMAVEFEDTGTAIGRLMESGIRVPKVQLSAALRLARAARAPHPRAWLGRFAEDTYLHQVVIAGPHGLRRFTDLGDALEQASDHDEAEEWRVHFHVPIFLASMSGFDTTQSDLAALLGTVMATLPDVCLEVETYTWDVLPPEYRTTDVTTAIARELTWVRSTLAA